MVFGMNKGIFDGTYLKHPTRSGACQSSGATKTLDGKTIVGFIYTFSKLKLICLDVVRAENSFLYNFGCSILIWK